MGSVTTRLPLVTSTCSISVPIVAENGRSPLRFCAVIAAGVESWANSGTRNDRPVIANNMTATCNCRILNLTDYFRFYLGPAAFLREFREQTERSQRNGNSAC